MASIHRWTLKKPLLMLLRARDELAMTRKQLFTKSLTLIKINAQLILS